MDTAKGEPTNTEYLALVFMYFAILCWINGLVWMALRMYRLPSEIPYTSHLAHLQYDGNSASDW